MKISLILLLFLGVVGCQQSNKVLKTKFIVTVVDDENSPIEGAGIVFDNEKKVTTKQSGVLNFSKRAKEGSVVEMVVSCPDEHLPVPQNKQYIVVRYTLLAHEESQNGLMPIETKFVCMPLVKHHVVIAKTNIDQSIPVLQNGKEVARIQDGLVQFVIEGSNNEEVEIVLDTSGIKNIAPQMPSRLLRLPQKRRFFIFEQEFVMVEPKLKKRKRKRVKRSTGPVRI